MATSNGEYIAVNKLYSISRDGVTLAKIKGLYLGGDKRYRVYGGSTVVWDIWKTTLTATDFTIGAKGGSVKGNTVVTSYGTDYDGNNTDLAYTFNPSTISRNDNFTKQEKNVIVTQTSSGTKVTIKCTQDANAVSGTSYGTPTATKAVASTVPAKGGTVTLTITWSQTKTTSYTNGTTADETVTGTATATISAGEVNLTGTELKDGVVTVPTAGTNEYTDNRLVYTISKYSFTANGKSATVGKSIKVYQQANSKTITYGAYSVTATTTISTIVNTGGTFKVSATCTQARTTTYTSGSTVNDSVNSTATVSSNRCSINITTFTGSGTITATVDENTGIARDCTVTVTAPDKTTTKSVTVKQDAVTYSFTTMYEAGIGAAGGNLELHVVSTRNGKDFAISTSNVTLSGLDGTKVSSVTAVTGGDIGEYSIIIWVPANTSTESRTFTITATQPVSGKTLTWTATQLGKTQPKKKAWYAGTFAFGLDLNTGLNDYSNIFASNSVMSAVGDDYTGGDLSDLKFIVSNKRDGTGTVISTKTIGDVSVENNSTTKIKLIGLTNSTASESVFVLVYYDNALQQVCDIMSNASPQ